MFDLDINNFKSSNVPEFISLIAQSLREEQPCPHILLELSKKSYYNEVKHASFYDAFSKYLTDCLEKNDFNIVSYLSNLSYIYEKLDVNIISESQRDYYLRERGTDDFIIPLEDDEEFPSIHTLVNFISLSAIKTLTIYGLKDQNIHSLFQIKECRLVVLRFIFLFESFSRERGFITERYYHKPLLQMIYNQFPSFGILVSRFDNEEHNKLFISSWFNNKKISSQEFDDFILCFSGLINQNVFDCLYTSSLYSFLELNINQNFIDDEQVCKILKLISLVQLVLSSDENNVDRLIKIMKNLNLKAQINLYHWIVNVIFNATVEYMQPPFINRLVYILNKIKSELNLNVNVEILYDYVIEEEITAHGGIHFYCKVLYLPLITKTSFNTSKK